MILTAADQLSGRAALWQAAAPRTEQDREVSYRAARLQAISLAYDDTLVLCCRLLDVPEPERPPWNPVTRLHIEAELARAGLDW